MVKPMTKTASETSIRMMPQVRSGRAVQDGLRRVQGPAGAGRPAGHEEARDQQQHGQQVEPVAEHVHVREHHVAGADHQRDQVVAEPAQEQRREQVDDHDHPVHADQLQVGARGDEGDTPREPELQPHEPREHQRHQPDRDRGHRVLDRDHLRVLAPDVLADEGLRVVELGLADLRSRCEFRFVVRNVSSHSPPSAWINAS